MEFEYYNPVKLLMGEGCVLKNAAEFRRLGQSCLIVTGKTSARASGALGDVTAALESQGIAWKLFDEIEPNPTLESSKRAGDMARAEGLGFIVGIGGGSPIDAAKAAAVYAANEMPLMKIYDQNVPNRALPIVAVGTTAGTGAEVGPAAVLTTPDGKKSSLTPLKLFPCIAFGDAKYTRSLPLRFTVSTALDSLTHAVEGYYSNAACELTDLFALEAVRELVPQLRLLAEAKDVSAVGPRERERLYYASILSGLTLARCGTTYCHTLGYLLTEQFDVPHGFACAALMPDAIRRGGRVMPQKAGRLFAHSGIGEDDLCALVERLTELPVMRIESGELEAYCQKSAGARNFARTPGGISHQEALALMSKLFQLRK